LAVLAVEDMYMYDLQNIVLLPKLFFPSWLAVLVRGVGKYRVFAGWLCGYCGRVVLPFGRGIRLVAIKCVGQMNGEVVYAGFFQAGF
jgi:hypothetical protein